jgi:hypothetical protein
MKNLLLAAVALAALSAPAHAAEWWWFNEFSQSCAPQDLEEAYKAIVDVWKDTEKASQAGSTTALPKHHDKPVLHVVSPSETEIVTPTDVERLYRTREVCQFASSAMQKK